MPCPKAFAPALRCVSLTVGIVAVGELEAVVAEPAVLHRRACPRRRLRPQPTCVSEV